MTTRIFKLTLLTLFSISHSACSQLKAGSGDTEVALGSSLPPAPIGYEWKLLESMSDEFEGVSLDKEKWNDSISTWQGRPPAEFLSKNVTVEDGNLEVKTSTHPNPSEKWKMAGAAVSGKNQATFGYFEARIKASKVRMSTTFWLHSDSYEDANLGCGKKHGIELDILEAIGGWYDSSWTNVVHSNTHYKPTDIVDGKCETQSYLSKGIQKLTPYHLGEDFHVYSMWWRNPNQMTFYFDGEPIGSVTLDHERDQLPFDGPMSLRMVSETYTWQENLAPEGMPPYPTDEELDDPLINTAYYDYVRSYKLIPSANNLLQEGDFERDVSAQWKNATGNTKRSNNRLDSFTHNFGLLVLKGDMLTRTIKVSQRGNYIFSYYSRTESGLNGATVTVYDSNGNKLAEHQVKSSEYSLNQFPVNLEKGDVQIRITNTTEHKSVFDNFSILKND